MAGSVVVSQVSPGRKNRLQFEIAGADATLSFDQEQPELAVGRPADLGGRAARPRLRRRGGRRGAAAGPSPGLPGLLRCRRRHL